MTANPPIWPESWYLLACPWHLAPWVPIRRILRCARRFLVVVAALQRNCPAQRISKVRNGIAGHIEGSLSLHRCMHCMQRGAMHAMQCNAGRIGWVQCAMSATKQSRSRGWRLQRQACAHWWTCNANARRATHFGRFWEFRCKACGSAEVSTPPTFGAEISTPNVSGAIKTATLRCLLCDLRDSVVQFFLVAALPRWRLTRFVSCNL